MPPLDPVVEVDAGVHAESYCGNGAVSGRNLLDLGEGEPAVPTVVALHEEPERTRKRRNPAHESPDAEGRAALPEMGPGTGARPGAGPEADHVPGAGVVEEGGSGGLVGWAHGPNYCGNRAGSGQGRAVIRRAVSS